MKTTAKPSKHTPEETHSECPHIRDITERSNRDLSCTRLMFYSGRSHHAPDLGESEVAIYIKTRSGLSHFLQLLERLEHDEQCDRRETCK